MGKLVESLIVLSGFVVLWKTRIESVWVVNHQNTDADVNNASATGAMRSRVVHKTLVGKSSHSFLSRTFSFLPNFSCSSTPQFQNPRSICQERRIIIDLLFKTLIFSSFLEYFFVFRLSLFDVFTLCNPFLLLQYAPRLSPLPFDRTLEIVSWSCIRIQPSG